MRLINSSFYYPHQHNSTSLLHLYLHPCLFLLSLLPSFFLFSLPPCCCFFFNCHCCTVRALGFPPSISQDRAAITAQERRRPAVRRGGKGAEESAPKGKVWNHILLPHSFSTSWTAGLHQGHHDQTGTVRNNAPCYDLSLLSAPSEHK